jgi:hypothetical protein
VKTEFVRLDVRMTTLVPTINHALTNNVKILAQFLDNVELVLNATSTIMELNAVVPLV